MSWIGISDGRRPILVPDYAGPLPAPLLASGTLLAELRFCAEAGGRQTVVALDRDCGGWPRRLRVTLGAEGDLFFEHGQGDAVTRAAMRFSPPDREDCLRITISWHAPQRIGLMTVENLDNGDLSQSVIEAPNPWPRDDIAALMARADGCAVGPSVTLMAFSDRVEPVGPNTGFAAGTLIDTPAGRRPVEDLLPGDLVQTSDHGMQPIRCVVSQQVPAHGRMAPVHLRAPFFGLSRDLTVAQNHRLLISGVDAEYLFGADSVLVEARHLATMAAEPPRRQPPTIRYVQVLLDAHVCLSVSGAWAESLYLGNLADHTLRHATSALARYPASRLPRHDRFASQGLRSYEAMVLVSALCA